MVISFRQGDDAQRLESASLEQFPKTAAGAFRRRVIFGRQAEPGVGETHHPDAGPAAQRMKW